MSESKRVSLISVTVICLGVVRFLAMRGSLWGTGVGTIGAETASSFQWIRWGSEATKRAQDEGKLILVDVYADLEGSEE